MPLFEEMTVLFLYSSMVFFTSFVTVPILEEGINPLGPRYLDNWLVTSGYARTVDNTKLYSEFPERICTTISMMHAGYQLIRSQHY